MNLINIKLIFLFIFVFTSSFTFESQVDNTQQISFNTASLEGTVWQYEDEDLMYEIQFINGGVLVTSHPHDITPGNDTWKQNEQNITFSYNNKFSVYEGKMVNENLIVGKAHNRSFSWEWKAYKISDKDSKKVLASAKTL